jgi:hypothetical protein
MINETKQTAVEWLYLKLSTSSSEEMVGNINVWFEQAKAMHKEEIENAFDIGVNSYYDLNSPSNWEQYYNETFGGSK